ncbi:MAG: DctP family TRAP transporter solute-binding subunit [Sulfuricellaceae bacterium]
MFRNLIVAIALLLVGATTAQAAQGLVMATSAGGVSPQQIAAEAFVAEVERLLPGRFAISKKSGSTMGGEQDIWQALRLGALDLAIVTTTSIAPDVPQLGILDVPYLFRDSAHAAKVLDGPIGHELGAKINGRGAVFLGFIDRGFRHLTNSRRPVLRPADVAGLKIRVIPNPVMEATFKALGAEVVPMPIPELFGALRERRIDGQENPLLVIESRRFDQVQKFLSLTGHTYSPAVVLVDTETYKALKPVERTAFARAARVAAAASRQAVSDKEKAAIAFLKQKGVAVVDTIDRDAFIAALAPLWPEWEKRFGADLLKRIRDTK